ncbi:MAG: glycosyltransferase family 2 protein [Deltaproteobacteria bacterium]|nr:glycosyltransferase family 2 protein [Deltaproteobacteria bacterium]
MSLSSLKTLVIIVNYKSSALTLQAVKSVLESQSLGPVNVVVVDNSAEPEEAETLRAELPPKAILQINPRNMGFGAACNQAFEAFDSDQILLINPDARLLPGCLKQLQKTLFFGRKIAAVSPQIFWDDEQVFYLPPPYPTVLFEFRPLLASWGSQAWINRFISLSWRRHSIKIWRSDKPVEVSNLSGGLVLLDRKAVQKTGGLFDPRFFLYFEDTDLFLRLKRNGSRLLIEPRARAIHYFDQCGRDQWQEKRRLMEESQTLFLGKHGNTRVAALKKIFERFYHPAMGRERFQSPDFESPFSLKVPSHFQKNWLFEWSPNPDMTPSAARFGTGPAMLFPEKWWKMFSPGQYFGRLGGIKRLGRPFHEISWIVRGSV